MCAIECWMCKCTLFRWMCRCSLYASGRGKEVNQQVVEVKFAVLCIFFISLPFIHPPAFLSISLYISTSLSFSHFLSLPLPLPCSISIVLPLLRTHPLPPLSPTFPSSPASFSSCALSLPLFPSFSSRAIFNKKNSLNGSSQRKVIIISKVVLKRFIALNDSKRNKEKIRCDY